MNDASLTAERLVRAFAAATNLVVAGQRIHVAGAGELAGALRSLLRALGGVSSEPDRADYVFLTAGDDRPSQAAAATDGLPFRDGAIVVDASDDGALATALEARGLAELATRPPSRRYRLADGRGLDMLRLDPATLGRDPFTARLDFTRRRAEALEPGSDAAARDADLRLDWARRFMPASSRVAASLAAEGALRGRRFGVSMVLEPKTAVLSLLLAEAGAQVSLYAHSDETDDAVADALRARGFAVHAGSGADADGQLANARAYLAEGHEFLLDDGSHLIRLAAHDGVELLGAAEETTSGLRPLHAMGDALRIPVLAVNDARVKTRFDNRYGTGQSCVFAIADLLDQLGRGFADARVAVVGFGPVGVGVAQHASALGAVVTVCELDPVRALEARYAGYDTAPLEDTVGTAHVVISATGEPQTITAAHLRTAGPGTAFAVAGGVLDEIALGDAQSLGARLESRAWKVDAVLWPGAEHGDRAGDDAASAAASGSGSGSDSPALVLDRGGCINITAAEGNPVQIMDLSFAAQLTAAGMLARCDVREPGVHPLPPSADEVIAAGILGADVGQRSPELAEAEPEFETRPEPTARNRRRSQTEGESQKPAWHPTRFPNA
ncbi:adenosylhomocysteinase [Pseudoclavibacter sp. RFBG4]|uniref:adenosylhomocysteinase n=1 Tax=Pseudoclavibacter sp. RFBG4 TaxID=2080575 RepID=UPI0011B05651|nr:adenosylhomocysteinase [Pseudoclavibacter sp. RFBG4]